MKVVKTVLLVAVIGFFGYWVVKLLYYLMIFRQNNKPKTLGTGGLRWAYVISLKNI